MRYIVINLVVAVIASLAMLMGAFANTPTVHGFVYVSDINGGKKKRLTKFHNWYEDHIAWQPGGELISLVAGPLDGSRSKLFVVSSDGTNLHAVAHGITNVTAPQWSPDGTSIAYIREKNDQEILYSVDLEKRYVRRISGKNESVESFSWDPDSSSLLYVNDLFNSVNRKWIDGKRRKLLGNRASPYDVWVGSDGTIAVSGLYAVSLYDLDGRYMRSLFRAPSLIGEAKWSPNGRWLAYTKETLEHGDTLYAARVDGKRRLRLGQRAYEVRSFDWGSNSKTVVYTNLDGGWVVSMKTRKRRRLRGVDDEGSLSVSPDGERIAYSY